MSDEVAVLFANESFYAAFLARDVEAITAQIVPSGTLPSMRRRANRSSSGSLPSAIFGR